MRKTEGISNTYPGEMREDSDMSYRYQEGFRVVVVSMLEEWGEEDSGEIYSPSYVAHLQYHFIMHMDISCILDE